MLQRTIFWTFLTSLIINIGCSKQVPVENKVISAKSANQLTLESHKKIILEKIVENAKIGACYTVDFTLSTELIQELISLGYIVNGGNVSWCE